MKTRSSRWRGMLVAPLLLAVPVFLLGPALLPGRAFLPLLPVQFAPLRQAYPAAAEQADRAANYLTSDRIFPVLTDQIELVRRVREGLPLTWEHRLGMGYPLLAGTLAAPVYPPNWLNLLLPPPRASAWLALLELVLAGGGMWLFLGRLSLGPGARALGTLALQAGGFAAANLHYGMKLDAALWLPWQLWAIEGLIAGKRAHGLCLFAATALSFLAGFPPIALFCSASAAVYALSRARSARSAMARSLLFLVLGAAAASVQLFPTLEASRNSLRGPKSSASLLAESLPLATSATAVLPNLFGEPSERVFAPSNAIAWLLCSREEAEKASHANSLEWTLFAGAGVVALSIAGLVARPSQALAPLVLLLFALGFAQGWPIVRLLYSRAGWNLGAPSRAMALAWVAWPWLAAVGAHSLFARCSRAVFAALVMLLLLALSGGALLAIQPELFAQKLERTLSERHGVESAQVREYVPEELARASGDRLRREGARLVAASLLMAVAVALAARQKGERIEASSGAWLLCALVALEGALEGRKHAAPRALEEPLALFPSSRAMDGLARIAGDGRVLRFDASASGVADVIELARPNLPQAYGIADLSPYVVFSPRAPVELFEALDPLTRYRTGLARLPSKELLGHPLLDLARVTAVLSREEIDHPRLELGYSEPGFFVYQRSGAEPIARVVPVGLAASSEVVAIGLWAKAVVDPRTTTVLSGKSAEHAADLRAPEHHPGTLTVRRPSPSSLDIAIEGSSGGFLVVRELFYPGWEATLNGEPVPILQADHACRAVRVPSGDSLVHMRYRPRSLSFGLAASALACLGAILALFWRS